MVVSVPIRLQNTCACDVCQFSKNLSTLKRTCKCRLFLKGSFRMCGRGAGPKSLISKFTEAVLWDWLDHHKKCVIELNGTGHDLRMNSEVVNSLPCY